MPDTAPPPLPGTIAYAEWKRKQEQAVKPGNQETGKLGRKETGREASQEAILEGKSEVAQEPSMEVKEEPSPPAVQAVDKGAGQAAAIRPLEETPVYKASFLYTQEEMELFEDLKLQMRRKNAIKVTKNDLARAGIRLLAEDYNRNQEKSFLVKASLAKPKR